ncbi:hypothetical protein HK096_006029, partial [Nowakowskiella sp. JEL0078]
MQTSQNVAFAKSLFLERDTMRDICISFIMGMPLGSIVICNEERGKSEYDHKKYDSRIIVASLLYVAVSRTLVENSSEGINLCGEVWDDIVEH